MAKARAGAAARTGRTLGATLRGRAGRRRAARRARRTGLSPRRFGG